MYCDKIDTYHNSILPISQCIQEPKRLSTMMIPRFVEIQEEISEYISQAGLN